MDLILQQLANALVLGSAYTLVVLGLYLLYSALHIPNFAHGEMFAVGAYLQYTFSSVLGTPFFFGLALATLASALLGIVLERLVFRRLSRGSGFSILIGSLALAVVLQEVIALVWGHDQVAVTDPISQTLQLGVVRIAGYRLLIVLIVIAAAIALALLVYRTSYGRSLRAIAQNREVAILAGVNAARVTAITFGVSAMLAGLAGGLLAPTTTVDPYMGFHPTLVAFSILVVIGSGARMTSVLVGSFAVAISETFAAALISNSARTAVVFLVLILFLLIKPEGARRLGTEMKVRL